MSKELADRQFEYLLNAMENAGAQDNPHEHGYGEKRKAALDYVSALRGTFADGIEAAAREIEILILPRSDDKDPDDELFFMFCEQGAKKLRVLAQGQRSEADNSGSTPQRGNSLNVSDSGANCHPSDHPQREPSMIEPRC